MLKALLSVILFLCFISIAYLTIMRGTFLETAHAKTQIDLSQIEKINNYTNEDIHELFDDVLISNKIPTEVLDEVLESNEHQKIIDDYLEEAKTSIKNGQDLPEIPTEKIESLLTKGVEKYNQKYNANLSTSKIKNIVEDLADQMENIQKFINQNVSFLKKLSMLLSDKLYYGILIVTFFVLILFVLIYKKEAIFSLGGISIFTGAVLFANYSILKIKELQSLLILLPIHIQNMTSDFFSSSMIFLGTGVIFLLTYYLLIKREAKKQKNI